MLSVTAMEKIVVPLAVALMVRGCAPGGVFAAVLTVSSELLPVAGLGLNDAIAPVGKPAAERVIEPAKLMRVRLMV